MNLLNKLNGVLKLKQLLLAAAVVVVFVTTYSLILPAITMERKTFCGKEEHKHTEECYADVKKLVCGQEESEGHTHTDSCYKEEKILVCELEENEDHKHGEECCATERALICDKQETPGHTHTEQCYTTEKELTCGKEEHTHTDKCFVDPETQTGNETAKTTESEDSTQQSESDAGKSETKKSAEKTESKEEKETPDETAKTEEAGAVFEGTLTAKGEDYSITVGCSAKAGIPKGAKLAVKEIRQNTSDYQGLVSDAGEALAVEEENVTYARFFDITIVDQEGNEIQPKVPVDVKINLDDLKENVPAEEEPQVIHFGEEAETVEAEQKGDAVSFEADGFSVYGVVYTVDFHYEVNGKKYEFSIPGGGFVSFEHLVEVLGIGIRNTNTDSEERDEQQISDTYDEAVTLNEVPVSEAAKKFVAEIESVEFSSPELVWIGKVNDTAAVGSLKIANKLEPEYSIDLTKEKIAKINAQMVEAGDWALISLKAFDTEETLTVRMKDGDVFTIRMTDAQISSQYISADGKHYEVTVTYGDEALIPDGSSLEITEFTKSSAEYKKAYETVTNANTAQQETAGESASADQKRSEQEESVVDPDSVIIDVLRTTPVEMDVLDISIFDKDHKLVEPKAPVKVSIVRKELPDVTSASTLDETLTVNHLINHAGRMKVETVAGANRDTSENIEVSEESLEVDFLTDSFSTYTISWGGGVAGAGISSIQEGQYIIYARDAANGNYYALLPQRKNDDTLNTVQLTNTNGVLSYSGDMSNLYWTYSNYNGSFRFSFRSANTTYYLAAGTFGQQVKTSTNGTAAYGNANTTLFGQYNNHLHAAGDTFLRCYNGSFQFINDVSSGWEGRSQVFFASEADNKTVTVHYGYMDGNTFKEFDDLPEGAQETYGAPSMVGDQLNVRYDIPGKDYVTTRLNNPVTGTQISPLLQTEVDTAAYWKYRIQNTTSVNDGINQWQAFDSGDNDIYVIYRDTPTKTSYDTGGINPEDLGAPAASKNFENNHDGTYDLILGVTGKSNQAHQKTHANVVIVLDTSSSMSYTYSENPRIELGYTRLSAAKSAICDLADQLFALNTEDDPAAVELAFVNFSHRVRNEQTMQTIYRGTNATSFKNMINATTDNGGTNYDTAIEAANSILWNDADPTYVVFVTDGDTVSRGYLKYNSSGDGSDHAGDWDGGTYYNHDQALYGDTYMERAREAAKIQVDKVLASGKKFYSIGVFGNVAYLEEMGGSYLGQANNKQAIQDAFSQIISEIEMDLGYKDVIVNDGLTALTSTKLEHGSAGNFTYYRSGGTNGNETEKYSSTANDGRGEIWNLEGTDKEAFFLEIKDANTFFKNGTAWTDLSEEKKAAYIEKYGVGSRTVIWDLGEDMLEDGVTYKVAFTIWPSQEAYDLVADLNNGTVEFDKLDDSVKSQIVENNGVYYVKTNTAATVDYTSVRTENGTVVETKTGSSGIRDPEGKMNLDTNIMTVRKDFAHLINEADPYEEIVFYLLVDGKYYNEDGTLSDTLDESKVYAINLPKNNKWEDQIYIAPGLMRGGEILETGHNYTLVEKIVSGNPYEYEFAPQTVRPMVITAVPTFLVKKDSFNTNEDDKQEYTFNDTNGTYTAVNGHSSAAGTYYAASENNGSLVGVNHKTSELDITKIIHDPDNLMSDAQEASDTFTYRVTLKIPDGCDPSGIVGYEYVPRTQSNAFTLFGYQTGQSAYAEDIARFNGKTYRAWNTLVYDALIEYDRITENGKTVIKARRDANGNIIWKIPAVNGFHTITYDMTLKQDEVIRFTNLPTGTKYTIQEIYANKYPADNTGGKTDGREPVSDAGNLAAEGYVIEQVKHTGGSLSADQSTVDGTIEAPDTRYYNQYNNKKVKEDDSTRAELKVKKVVEDYTWGEEYYRFTLTPGTAEYSDTEGGTGTSPMPDGTQNSVVSIYNTTPDHMLSFGAIRYTRPGTYIYTVTEYDNSGNMPFVQFAAPVTLTVTVTADHDGKLTVAQIADDKGTTVYSAEMNTAVAAGLTTQTNTSKKIHIKKVDKDKITVLADAEFEILSGGTLMYLQEGKLLDAETVEEIIEMAVSAEGADAAMEENAIRSRFTLGEIDIRGFASDVVYELKEVAPPDGYIIVSESTYFKVIREGAQIYLRLTDQNGNVLTDDNSEPVLENDSAAVSQNGLTISIKNEPGAALPSTGGPGTKGYMIFGAVLIAGAGLLLWRRRRLF